MAKRKRKAIVAVVGRPNVGKSTLFNVLAGRRISIVEDTPGVTRDRIYADCSWLDKDFTLIDTGGIEPDSKDVILSQMHAVCPRQKCNIEAVVNKQRHVVIVAQRDEPSRLFQHTFPRPVLFPVLHQGHARLQCLLHRVK